MIEMNLRPPQCNEQEFYDILNYSRTHPNCTYMDWLEQTEFAVLYKKSEEERVNMNKELTDLKNKICEYETSRISSSMS